MRRLVLMRHSKTEHHNLGGDHARRLTAAGIQAAQEAGIAMRPLGISAAIVSTSTRTRETFTALGLHIPVAYLDDLYYDGTDAAARLIAGTDDAVGSLLVVGHSPTIPDLAAGLLYASSPGESDQVGSWFPTSAFSTFTLDGSWRDLFTDGVVGYEGTHRPATRP